MDQSRISFTEVSASLKDLLPVIDETTWRDTGWPMPRKAGMERRDLLAANAKIFKSQGKALAEYAKASTKIIVVANPANTMALICSKYAAPKISARNISAMTRLDHNRAAALVSE
nr:Lactate malate dehydrogenase domain containing protein [Haemonchus contortus]